MESISNLEKYCSKNRSLLIESVNILLEGEYTNYESRENALKGHVCGRATRVLGYLMNRDGYNVTKATTELLGWDYVCPNHCFLIVEQDNSQGHK